MLKGYRSVGFGLGLSSPPNIYRGACAFYERWLETERGEAATTEELAMARMLRLLAEIEANDVPLPVDACMELVADKLELEALLLGETTSIGDRFYPAEPEKWLDDRQYAAWRSRLRSLYQAGI